MSAALLRTYDRAEFERDGRAGGPVPCAYCPRCRCTKSGYADEPNAITEACDDSSCPCHGDEECVTCGHFGSEHDPGRCVPCHENADFYDLHREPIGSTAPRWTACVEFRKPVIE